MNKPIEIGEAMPQDGFLTWGIRILAGVLALVVGAMLAFWVAQPLGSLLGLDTDAGMWYVTRAAGLVGYMLLWLSTLWGLAVATKIFDPLLHRAFTFDAHEFLSLLAIGFIGLHVGVLLIDAYMPFSLVELLVPFTSVYRPLWVGIGVISMYLTLLVTVTFYLRTRIGYAAFRAIHLLSFLAYAGVTIHSILAGTDTALVSTKLVYAGTALVIAILSMQYWRMRRGKQAQSLKLKAQN